MADELQTKLVTTLTSLRDKGRTPTQAVEQIIQALGGHYQDVHRISVLNATLISDVLYSVYQEALSPQELTILLRNMGYEPQDIALAMHTSFATLNAQAIGALLLDAQVYPQTEKQEIHLALRFARFPAPECDRAVAALYPA